MDNKIYNKRKINLSAAGVNNLVALKDNANEIYRQ